MNIIIATNAAVPAAKLIGVGEFTGETIRSLLASAIRADLDNRLVVELVKDVSILIVLAEFLPLNKAGVQQSESGWVLEMR
jgi:hypothetical protein